MELSDVEVNLQTLKSKLNHLLDETTINFTQEQREQLFTYITLLLKWNKAYNLTSVRDPQEMLVKHLLDSVVVEPYLHGQRFIDVGTGPGLPGIPLAITRPDAEFVLLDSLGKRVRFLKQVQYELGLTNITPVQSRVEDFSDPLGFDGIISRAFASLRDMTDLCGHLLAKKGAFYALKGVYPADELENLSTDLLVDSVIRLSVPELEAERHLVVIKSL